MSYYYIALYLPIKENFKSWTSMHIKLLKAFTLGCFHVIWLWFTAYLLTSLLFIYLFVYMCLWSHGSWRLVEIQVLMCSGLKKRRGQESVTWRMSLVEYPMTLSTCYWSMSQLLQTNSVGSLVLRWTCKWLNNLFVLAFFFQYLTPLLYFYKFSVFRSNNDNRNFGRFL